MTEKKAETKKKVSGKELDTKETMEMIAAIKIINTFVAAVLQDHKVTNADLAHLVTLSTKYQAMADAWTGKEKILPEIKNLKKDELAEVIVALYDAFEVFTSAKTIAAFR